MLSLLGSARRNALIVAPFIRSAALSRLVDCIAVGAEVIVVTRWRPIDLIAGASDLGVFDVAHAREIPLYLRHDLHAKLFAGDDKCLVGSANVTLSGLGWRIPYNLELLTPVPRSAKHIIAFEATLFANAVRATVDQRDELAVLVDKLAHKEMPKWGADQGVGSAEALSAEWVPQTRNPEELYAVYQGGSDVSRSALGTMQEELRQLGVMRGLDREGFQAWVASVIRQNPLISGVLRRLDGRGPSQ